MSDTVYEFPLKEKVRNYLRIEHLLTQLTLASQDVSQHTHLSFLEQIFTLLDLFERLDIRTDLVKDFDVYERNLVHWSQHPNINSDALEKTLASIIRTRDSLKSAKKFGSELKEDKFLSSIRQRFSIPGGNCAFDLPNLHYWLTQSEQVKKQSMTEWRQAFTLLQDSIGILLSFLREKGQFTTHIAPNGFFQGVADDNSELIRIRCQSDVGYYPALSGNKYRYALRFMWFSPTPEQTSNVDKEVTFELASC